jgi:hypothetical protein
MATTEYIRASADRLRRGLSNGLLRGHALSVLKHMNGSLTDLINHIEGQQDGKQAKAKERRAAPKAKKR